MKHRSYQTSRPWGAPALCPPERKTMREAQALAREAAAEGRLASFLGELIEPIEPEADEHLRVIQALLDGLKRREGTRSATAGSPRARRGPQL